MKNPALYLRCSTVMQDLEQQREALIKSVTCDNYSEYADFAVSGMVESRPELDRMMGAIHEGKHDYVIVWKLDRFARSVLHLVELVLELQKHKVTFMSLTENIDLSTPAGKFQFHILAAVGEFERALIVERVKFGVTHKIAQLKAQGKIKKRRDT